MSLNSEQRTQVKLQLEEHRHEQYSTVIHLGLPERPELRGFYVNQGVYRSDVMITRRVTSYLVEHPALYTGRRVLDLGCGTGNLGVVMAALGAEHVMLSDICERSVTNAIENVDQFGLRDCCEVTHSDLFERIHGRFDLIVFNHPFFPDEPILAQPVSRAMLDPGRLLRRFLSEAPAHLMPGGTVLMPYLQLAGPTNHPAIQGRCHGFVVRRVQRFTEYMGLQTGRSAIYRLSPRGH